EVKEFDPTLLVAIGGGSPIDVAKVISVMLKNEGDITEFIGVPEAFRNPGVPLIAIPTTAGSGSEVTPYAVLTDFEKVRKAPLISRHLFPVLAIDDPELTVTMSPILTTSTGVDALTHAIESLLSKRATPISKLYSMKAIKLVFRFLPRAYGNPKDLQAREGMMLASLLGGMAITDAGAGLVHTLAHILGVLYRVPHGIANGVFLLPVLKFYGLSASSALEELSEYLGFSGWKKFLEELSDLLSFVGIPSKLSHFGVKEYDVAQFVSLTMEKKFLMGHLPRIPSEREIRVLIEEML
ncbi:MAG: iron-containing alcohol dehydrogenase, partial [Desulfurobacteriaceae bacterium]